MRKKYYPRLNKPIMDNPADGFSYENVKMERINSIKKDLEKLEKQLNSLTREEIEGQIIIMIIDREGKSKKWQSSIRNIFRHINQVEWLLRESTKHKYL